MKIRNLTIMNLPIALLGFLSLNASQATTLYSMQKTPSTTAPNASSTTGQTCSKVAETQVTNAEQLVAAFAKAKGQTTSSEICLADGVYKIEQPLHLIAASNIKISAAKKATIVSHSGQSNVLVITHCKNIELVNLALNHNPPTSDSDTHSHLPLHNSDTLATGSIGIDHSTNVRLVDCSLEFAITKSGEPAMLFPEILVKEIGQAPLEIIATPDKILTFQLDPRAQKADKMLGTQAIVKEGPALTPKQTKQLCDLLLNEESYIMGMAKNGFSINEFGLRFIKGDQHVDVLVDHYRKELHFIHLGADSIQNSDPMAKALKQLTTELFPE